MGFETGCGYGFVWVVIFSCGRFCGCDFDGFCGVSFPMLVVAGSGL